MSKTMKTYFAILHKDADSAVGVVFPDLPGCFSAGDSYEEAISNAEKALALYAQAELGAGRTLPDPSPFDELYASRQIRDEAAQAPFVGIQLIEAARGHTGIYRDTESGEIIAVSGDEDVATTAPEMGKRRAQSARER